MKKVAILLLLVLVVDSVSAQHLKFEGIPIDGTITSFQSKLSARGIIVDNVKSKKAPLGQRVFKGKFQGYNSEITVYYGRKSRIVYKVEAFIESKKKDFIQGILDKSIAQIESKYIYTSDHDVTFASMMCFKYNIFSNSNCEKNVGTIQIKPSHSYYVNDEGRFKGVASFNITFDFVDRENLDAMLPSETEPYAFRSFTCERPENFIRFSNYAIKYAQNGCYDNAIFYFNWVLDYYKYGCQPLSPNYKYGSKKDDLDDYESMLDSIIMTLGSRQIGTLRTGGSSKANPVFRVVNNSTDDFQCIEFAAESTRDFFIQLDKNQIAQHIKYMKKLEKIFIEKQEAISNNPINELFYKEEIKDIYMSAKIGEDLKKDGGYGDFGDIEWNNKYLNTYFSYSNNILRLEITGDEDYHYMLRFENVEQIETYIDLLKSVEY